MLLTGNHKRRHLCVCVEEALGDRGTSLDTRSSVEAKHYQPRLMPRASLSRLFKLWAVFKVFNVCVCVCMYVGSVFLNAI